MSITTEQNSDSTINQPQWLSKHETVTQRIPEFHPKGSRPGFLTVRFCERWVARRVDVEVAHQPRGDHVSGWCCADCYLITRDSHFVCFCIVLRNFLVDAETVFDAKSPVVDAASDDLSFDTTAYE